MTNDTLYVGVDVGTTAVKAALYHSAGDVQSMETVPVPTDTPKPGWSEQSMSLVWGAAAKAISGACENIDSKRIVSVGVCGQGDGLWMLDAQLEPVRPAILWNDQRATAKVSSWIEDGTSDQLSRYCGTAIWAGASGAAFTWIKENEPQIVGEIRHVFHCKDWINFNLTGNVSTDFTDASIPFLNYWQRAFSQESFKLLDVEELADLHPAPVIATTPHGVVSPQAAENTGLPVSTPIATGCLDVASMMVGMGLRHTGDMCLILGTTAVLAVVIDPEEFSQPPVGATILHPFLDKWLRVTAPLSGASALDWFNQLDFESGDLDDAGYIARNEEISKVPAGSNGLMFLPFLSGERAPFVAPSASASFLGVTSSTTKWDMARAVMEGAAMSLRHCFSATGLSKPEKLFVTGGGARNSLWCDVIASIMNTTIVASDASDHGLWGAAQIGAASAGLLDMDNAPARNEALRMHEPNPNEVETYDQLFGLYKQYVELSMPQWEARKQFMGKAE